MKVYIATDLEGASGVVQESQSRPDQSRYHDGRIALTKDVNAAVLGAQDAGAKEIIVYDGHARAYNFIYEDLVDGAKYYFGGSGTTYLEGLDETFDAVLGVARHAMAGTKGAFLDHTMGSRDNPNMWLNGERIGDIELGAYVAGYFGVPFVFVSGDDKVCEEAKKLISENIVTACIKWGVKRQKGFCLAPGDARRLIRKKVCEAIKKASTISPLKIEGPCELKIEYLRTEMCEAFWNREDVEMPDARTVIFRRENILDAANDLLSLHWSVMAKGVSQKEKNK